MVFIALLALIASIVTWRITSSLHPDFTIISPLSENIQPAAGIIPISIRIMSIGGYQYQVELSAEQYLFHFLNG
jgi:hypothetical protein